MEAFRVSELREAGRKYVEFVHSRDLSAGIYRLAAGAVDGHQTHGEDEMYYVIAGRAQFSASEDDREVAAGDVLFVAAGEPHRLHDLVEDLELLVFFGPAEGTRLNSRA
jgi:quercetin dioxygenase-like cupin family protein